MIRVKSPTESSNKRQAPLLVKYILPVAIIVLVVGAYLTYQAWMGGKSAQEADEARFLTMSELEELYGIRVTLVAVTAAGGMVDFRFKVIDPDKARAIIEPGNLPSLSVPGRSTILGAPEGTFHDTEFEAGKIYYILYGNTGGLVRPGMPVSVKFGDMQLEPITAQ